MTLKHCVPLETSLTQTLYWAKQVRDNESKVAKQFGLSMWQLMANAGASAFELMRFKWPKAKRILLVVGKGNNAGDAFVLGKLAIEQGIDVDILSPFADLDEAMFKEDALKAYQELLGAATPEFARENQFTVHAFSSQELTPQDLNQYDVIIDGLLGTGFKPPLAEVYTAIVELVNYSKTQVLSLDLPSGLDADTGFAFNPVIEAEHTVTFVAVKAGLVTADSADFCGQLWLADLAIGHAFNEAVESNISVFTETSIKLANQMPTHMLSRRKKNSHKGSHGFILAFVANQGYAGAGRLSCEAALRSGASMVAVACHQSSSNAIVSARPEVIIAGDDFSSEHFKGMLAKANCLVVGPGLGQNTWAERAWQLALAQDKSMVVDADALNLLAKTPSYRNNWVLTPHPGEAARLLGWKTSEVQQNRFAAITKTQQKYGGICLLKGAGTLVTDGHEISVNTSGNEGMASAGMGDVLSGIIAALLQQCGDPFDAVKLAAYVHGKAADFAVESGVKGLLASDLFTPLRRLVNHYSQ